MSEKVTGYLLLLLGLVLIGFSAFSVYQVFTKRAQPLQLFSEAGISLNFPDAKTELVSANYLNSVSNLTSHYLLMSFLVSIGFKISSLGIQLLRPIEVKLQARPA